jgi:hypothetical protein
MEQKTSKKLKQTLENSCKTGRKQLENIGKQVKNIVTTIEDTQTTDTPLSQLDIVK